MSWEALRLTSRTPSEVYHVTGPCGVDSLVHKAFQHCWDALPADQRSFKAWQALAREVYGRNMAVWARIKKPAPANFFEDLRPEPADGFMRQAMVLGWMMLPVGKRVFANVKDLIQRIVERNFAAWEEDNETFTLGRRKRRPPPPPPARKKAAAPAKAPATKKSAPPARPSAAKRGRR